MILLLISGCAASHILTKPLALPVCHAIFDAGSTGTRLFIYYQQKGEWTEVEGPKAGPLKQANSIVKIVGLLEEIKTSHQNNKVFDWSIECDSLSSIQVLATAGMRLEEKNAPENSGLLWKSLNDALHADYASTLAEISTKTITGDEEAVYAWLAVKHWRDQNRIKGIDFGLAEMGGGSSQVAFPCGSKCVNAKTVIVDGQQVEFFIHSFLELGTAKLPGSIQSSPEIPRSCEWGIAQRKPGWNVPLCLAAIKPRLLNDLGEIKDPNLNQFIAIPKHDHLKDWYLTSSLAYMDIRADKDGDVQSCCVHRRAKNKGCYQEEKSCYLAVYQPFYLEALGIENIQYAKQSKTSWTLGAAICSTNNCFNKSKASRKCKWLPENKCLVEPVLVKSNN